MPFSTLKINKKKIDANIILTIVPKRKFIIIVVIIIIVIIIIFINFNLREIICLLIVSLY